MSTQVTERQWKNPTQSDLQRARAQAEQQRRTPKVYSDPVEGQAISDARFRQWLLRTSIADQIGGPHNMLLNFTEAFADLARMGWMEREEADARIEFCEGYRRRL